MPENLKPRPFSRKWLWAIAVVIFLAVGMGISLFVLRARRNSPFDDTYVIGRGVFLSALSLLLLWNRYRSKDE